MKSYRTTYSKSLCPSCNSMIPAGTEVFVNKLPWDWNIHIRVDYLKSDEYIATIYNAEILEGELNPNMDDLYRVVWFEQVYKDIALFQDKLSYLGIKVPDNFFDNILLWKKHKTKGNHFGPPKENPTHLN